MSMGGTAVYRMYYAKKDQIDLWASLLPMEQGKVASHCQNWT